MQMHFVNYLINKIKYTFCIELRRLLSKRNNKVVNKTKILNEESAKVTIALGHKQTKITSGFFGSSSRLSTYKYTYILERTPT